MKQHRFIPLAILLAFAGTVALSLPAQAECGIASWYHEGKRTANGERYNPDGLTAAHRRLRFGTILRVVNMRNGRDVLVRINDRGPAKWTGRFLDLSRGAAKILGIIKSGTTRVCIHGGK